jgi:hypothetical protein
VGSGADVEGPEQAVELVQFSSRSIDPIRQETDPRHKVTSIQLGHFGAFYKASWRANDFLWGRVDGTTQIVRLLIDSGGLIRPGDTPVDVRTRLGRVLNPDYEPGWAGAPPGLEKEWDEACREIDEAMTGSSSSQSTDHPDRSPTQRLLKTGDLLAKAAILEYLPGELRAVADAVAVDNAVGATSERSGRFLRLADTTLPPTCTDTPARGADQVKAVRDLFISCRIGEEGIKEELGSDYLTQLAARSGAIAVSALGSLPPKRLSFKGRLLGQVPRVVRGAFLSVYLMASSVLGAGKRLAGPTAIIALYALTGLLFGWAISDQPPTWVPPVGAVSLAAALLFAVARNRWTAGRRWLMHLCLWATAVLCLGAGALPWVGTFFWEAGKEPGVFAFFRDQRAFLVTGFLVLGLLALGWLTMKPRSAPPLRESPTWGPAPEAPTDATPLLPGDGPTE